MRENKLLLLLSSLGTLIVLGAAAVRETYFADWRQSQARIAQIDPELEPHLRQVVVPGLKVVDRCVSCHVGMAAGEAGIAGDPIYGQHKNVVHDPADFGCTVCHGGQGRATEKEEAHGEVHFWPSPMLPRAYLYAGCGACHTHLAVRSADPLARGQAVFEQRDCLACHRVDGRGGTLRPGGAGGAEGPDLSRVGALGWARDWYPKHRAHQAAPQGALPWAPTFGPLAPEDLAALDTYLASRVGAPGLIEAKSLFHSLGCRGCHKVQGVGGADGPDLTRVGRRDPGLLPWGYFQGPRTLARWFKEHFRAPANVVPGSTMPALALPERQIDQLTMYMFSLRTSDAPEAYWPKDRIEAVRFGAREFEPTGPTLYGTFCAACHGPNGEGRNYPGMPSFPAVANPDFLAIAPDALLRATVEQGRTGRRMPAWGTQEGGLRAEEIDAVVAHLRALGGVAQERDTRPPRWLEPAPAGLVLYQQSCAGCHGPKGEGGEGPSLNNAVLLANATDTYLVETVKRGRRGTRMESFLAPSPTRRSLDSQEIESVVAYLRTWERKP